MNKRAVFTKQFTAFHAKNSNYVQSNYESMEQKINMKNMSINNMYEIFFRVLFMQIYKFYGDFLFIWKIKNEKVFFNEFNFLVLPLFYLKKFEIFVEKMASARGFVTDYPWAIFMEKPFLV